MLLVRGRGPTPDADRRATRRLLEVVGGHREPAVRVWRPDRQVAFGPRDVRHDGFPAAARAAEGQGFPPVERSVGGHPVAFTGTTVALASVVPIDDPRRGMQARYDATLGSLEAALADLGVDATRGEPPDSFCPGSHSLSAGGKLLGLAQRVTADAAAVAGVLVTAEEGAFVDVLEPVYRHLGLPLDPESVASVAAAGGPADPDRVARAVERRLVDGAEARAVGVDGLARLEPPDGAG